MHCDRLLFVLLACAAGCSPEVVVGSTAAGGSGGSGGATAGVAGTSPSGGSAGSGGASAGFGGFAGSGGDIIGSGGFPGYCSGSDFFFLIEGDGASQVYDLACQPVGYLLKGGGGAPKPDDGGDNPPPPPPGQESLRLSACPAANTIILDINSTMSLPGAADQAFFQYKVSNQGDGKLGISEFGDVGEAIVGEYSAIVSGSDPGSPTLNIFGKFRVCRTDDFHAP